jgi:hypothetical protein
LGLFVAVASALSHPVWHGLGNGQAQAMEHSKLRPEETSKGTSNFESHLATARNTIVYWC